MAGLKRARENGRIGGRAKGLSDKAKKTAYAVYHLTDENQKKAPIDRMSVEEMCGVFHISRATFYRYLDFAKNSFLESSVSKIWKKQSL